MTAPVPRTVEDALALDDQIEALVRLDRDLAASIEALTEQRAGLRKRFADLVPVGYTIEIDGKVASRTAPNRAFDLTTALELAHVAGIAVKWVPTPDAADLKDRLRAVGRLDAAMLPSGPEQVTL